MPTSEDVEAINEFLSTRKKPVAEAETPPPEGNSPLLHRIQQAVFGETHAHYASSSAGPNTPRATTGGKINAVENESSPVVSTAPAAFSSSHFSIPSRDSTESKKEISSTPSSSAAPATPSSVSAAPETITPPAARFNPNPLPYTKPTPSPQQFSDSTAPPWVMRTLPAEARSDTPFVSPRQSQSKEIASSVQRYPSTVTLSSSSSSSPPAPANARSSNSVFPAKTIPVLEKKSTISTRQQLEKLVEETQGKEGNESGHSLPWHAPPSKEIMPNELVGISFPTYSVSSPSMSPISPSDALQPHEHAYLAQREKEFDRGNSSPTLIENNTAKDEKQAILLRLKEMMAEHSGTNAP